MARPTLGDSPTERLHVKITSDELDKIDDWRFANRVPSRSEAIRRLCQIGLQADDVIAKAAAEAYPLFKSFEELSEESSFSRRRRMNSWFSKNFGEILNVMAIVLDFMVIVDIVKNRDLKDQKSVDASKRINEVERAFRSLESELEKRGNR